MMRNSMRKPHVGEYIKWALEDRHVKLSDFGIAGIEVMRIVKGKSKVDENNVDGIVKAMGSTRKFWLNIQKAYDEDNK